MRVADDGCGCFPSGRHYAGIAHLLRVTVRGLVSGFEGEAPWRDLPIALLDVETTGRDAATDRIVELGIVVGRAGEITARHEWLVHPERKIPDEARAVHGISDEDVKDAPRFREILPEITKALEGVIPAAYNAEFDKAFVENEFARAGAKSRPAALSRDVDWLDPLVWAREVHQGEKSRALGDMAARLGIAHEKAHRATDDAEAALLVLYALGKDLRVPKTYGALVQEQRRLSLAQADQRRLWRSPQKK